MEYQCQSPAFGIPVSVEWYKLSTRNIQFRMQPAIKELLHTNRVPTDTQKCDIIDLIQVHQARKSDIEFERKRLLRALEKTAQTLVEVSNMIMDLQATLSPIK